jgi:Zn-dependent protease
MFGKQLRLFRLFGFQVKVDLSWLIIFVLVSSSLAAGVFPQQYEGLSQATYWVMGIIAALGLFAAVVVHEFSHSLVARMGGMEMRGITLFIFGGVAEMDDEPPSAKTEFFMAIAGPIASLLIGLACLGLWQAGQVAGWPVAVNGVLLWLGLINLVVMVFNLLPAFPLDGGRVLRAAIWGITGNLRRATRVASSIGAAFGIILIFFGIIRVFATEQWLGGLWMGLLGLFLYGAAQQSYRQLIVRRILEDEPISRLMEPDVRSVSPSTTLQQFVDDYVYRHHHKMFPVTDETKDPSGSNGHLLGCMTTRQLHEVPREEWPKRRVEEVLQPCDANNTIDADADAIEVMERMRKSGSSRLLVTHNGRLRGIITHRDLMQMISLKLELEEDG